MKKILFVALLITTIDSTSFAQNGKHHIRVKKEILIQLVLLSDAWARSDTNTLSKLLTEEYIHTDIMGNFLKRREWLAYAGSPREVTHLLVNDVEMILYNRKLAVLTGRMNFSYGKDKIEQELRFTQLWSKYGMQWKRSAFQATIVSP